MRRRTYLLLGRLAGPFAIMGLNLYSLITGRPRVRVLVTNEKREVLLMRGVLSRGRKWSLPGGGVNRHESPQAAARRELHEETGIDKPLREFSYIRTIAKSDLGLSFEVPVFHIKVVKNNLPKALYNPIEVAEIAWFRPDKLPLERTKLIDFVLNEFDV